MTMEANALIERTDEQIKKALAGKPGDVIAALLALRDYAKAGNLGLKKLSQQTRMPTGVLSQLFSGTYPGDYEARAAKISKFLVDVEKARIYGGCQDFVETSIAAGLWRVFDKTRFNRRIQFIQSEEQIGKSKAAVEYAHRNNGGRTQLITCPPAESPQGCRIFLREMGHVMDIPSSIKLIDLRFRVREALASCDLIILDDAHQMKYWSDRAVREFLDVVRIYLHADGERGVVLIATNEDMLSLIQNFRKRMRYNIGQILGRMCNEILEISPDQIPIEDVRLLAERYKFKPRRSTIEKLYDVAIRPHMGHFGLILDVLNRTWADCQVDEKDMTDELVMEKLKETLADLEERADLYK